MNYNKTMTIVASFAVMLTIAIASGIRGLLVPSFMNYFQVSSYQIGLLFSLTTAVSVVAAFLTAPMCKLIGFKGTVLSGVLINVLGFYFTAQTENYLFFTLGYCLITFGITFTITCLNTVVTVIKVAFQAVLVNMLHFFFGLGITVSQKFGGDLLGLGFVWQDFFVAMAILYGAVALLVVFVSFPEASSNSKATGYADIPNKKFIFMICIALGLYICAEFQTGNWMINYLNKVYGYSEAHAGVFAAIFFGTFSIGRFLGGFIAEKLGYAKSVLIFASMASILFIAGMTFGEGGLYILSSSGFFFSLIYPTMTLYLANLYPKHKSSVIGLVSTACNFLALLSSFTIGYLNDAIGTGLAFWIIPICLATSAVLFIILLRKEPITE